MASRDKMSTISSDNEDTILLPRQTSKPKPTIPYPIALSHDFELDEWDQEHGYSPKCKDCGTCDHYDGCILDEVYFRIFYPKFLLCGSCKDSVPPGPGRKRYLLTDDMKTTYHQDSGVKCLACRSEQIWPPHKRVCKSCYLQLPKADRITSVMTIAGFGTNVDVNGVCDTCHVSFPSPSPRHVTTVSCDTMKQM